MVRPIDGADDPRRPDIGTVAEVDPATLPAVNIDPPVAGLSAGLATPEGAQDLAATLAWNLRVEAEAVATGDASLLPAIADGERLHELQAVIEEESAGGQRVIPTYTFDSLDLKVVYPGGLQRGAKAGLAPDHVARSRRSCDRSPARSSNGANGRLPSCSPSAGRHRDAG